MFFISIPLTGFDKHVKVVMNSRMTKISQYAYQFKRSFKAQC